MLSREWNLAVLALVAFAAGAPAHADLALFVSAVDFDSEANLESSLGLGIRWGKSSRLLGAETSLLVARPDRDLGAIKETATALLYEGRFMVNIPVGKVKPFLSFGLGAVTITSTDVPRRLPGSLGEGVRGVLNAVSDTRTNAAFSYGTGASYSLGTRVDLRVDLRQYLTFSVKRLLVDQVASPLGGQGGEGSIEERLSRDSTVQHNEFSFGLNFRF